MAKSQPSVSEPVCASRFWCSPGNDFALVVEVLETGATALGVDGPHQVGDALVDSEASVWPAEVGLHPAWSQEEQRPWVVVVAVGIAAHQLIEGRFAGPVDLEAASVVVGNAPLTGGHERDRAVGKNNVTECFDDPH